MKNKNAVLGTIALLSAMGTALASVAVSSTAKIKVQYGDEDSPVQCLDTQIRCSASGTSICTIIVPLASGSNATASSVGPVYVFGNTSCSSVVFGDESTMETATINGIKPERLISGI